MTQRQRAVSFFRSNAAGLHHRFIACLKNFSMGMSVPNPPGHGPQSIIFSTFMTKHYCLHHFFVSCLVSVKMCGRVQRKSNIGRVLRITICLKKGDSVKAGVGWGGKWELIGKSGVGWGK